DTLKFFASGKRARDNSVISEKELKGGVDYEQKIRDKWSWYTRLGLEYDVIELLDLRTTAAAGFGYQVFDTPEHSLRLRTGLQYKHESYADGRNESAPGLDLGINHRLKLGPAMLATDVTYTPAFEDFTRYNLLHTTSLDWPLSETWSLRLGVENDYNSQPVIGTKRLDTSYFMRAVLSWQ
ncbi:MAG: putative salt-induced outer membrane protein YdiY, partial [Rhodothermales bacterium]